MRLRVVIEWSLTKKSIIQKLGIVFELDDAAKHCRGLCGRREVVL